MKKFFRHLSDKNIQKIKLDESIKAIQNFIEIVNDILKDDAICEHDVNICWCVYLKAMAEAQQAIDDMRKLNGGGE